jgi:phospholipid-binding lipoprotein MlaA
MRILAVLLASVTLLSTSCARNTEAGEVLLRNETAQLEDVQETPEIIGDEDENDPLENVNRGVFEFNLFVDRWAIKPASQVYRDYLPQVVQDSVRSFLRNLRSPIIFGNNVLQGDFEGAGNTLGRFVVNSTLGVGGLFDPAGDQLDMPFKDEDLGQTLGVWGIGEGPYLVLPILGPSNPRDLVGVASEWYLDPLNLYATNNDADWVPWVRAGLRGIDTRARSIDVLDELERTSLDYYAAIRSLYRQQRANDIRNNRSEDETPSVSKAAVTLPDDVVSFRR